MKGKLLRASMLLLVGVLLLALPASAAPKPPPSKIKITSWTVTPSYLMDENGVYTWSWAAHVEWTGSPVYAQLGIMNCLGPSYPWPFCEWDWTHSAQQVRVAAGTTALDLNLGPYLAKASSDECYMGAVVRLLDRRGTTWAAEGVPWGCWSYQ